MLLLCIIGLRITIFRDCCITNYCITNAVVRALQAVIGQQYINYEASLSKASKVSSVTSQY